MNKQNGIKEKDDLQTETACWGDWFSNETVGNRVGILERKNINGVEGQLLQK